MSEPLLDSRSTLFSTPRLALRGHRLLTMLLSYMALSLITLNTARSQTSPALDSVTLSMERFESLFVTSSQREGRVDWSDPQLIIDHSD